MDGLNPHSDFSYDQVGIYPCKTCGHPPVLNFGHDIVIRCPDCGQWYGWKNFMDLHDANAMTAALYQLIAVWNVENNKPSVTPKKIKVVKGGRKHGHKKRS